jgi:hypothetical protein
LKTELDKFEIRSTKSETIPKFKTSMSETFIRVKNKYDPNNINHENTKKSISDRIDRIDGIAFSQFPVETEKGVIQ